MNYAVARSLYEHQLLSKIYTDICSDKEPWKFIFELAKKLGSEPAARFCSRRISIDHSMIVQFPLFAFEYFLKKSNLKSKSQEFSNYIEAQNQFSRNISKVIAKDNASHLYLFNTCALGLIKSNSDRKIVLELCSLPFGDYLARIIKAELQYPDWSNMHHESLLSDAHVIQYIEEEKNEINLADKIVVPSNEVYQSLKKYPTGTEDIQVIPYGYSFDKEYKFRNLGQRMRIAMIGTVELRKGIQHFYNISKRCSFFDFIAIGAVGSSLPVSKIIELSKNIILTGHLNRVNLLKELERVDVLLFLSLGEGSATAIYEALNLGIPVITTKESGSIVEHGKSGYIVFANDYEDISAKLELLSDKEHYRMMSEEALQRSKYGSRKAYSERLIEALV
ncbi:MAG: glycosyltransferase family 4 protein [Saprospiraceae bacterium]